MRREFVTADTRAEASRLAPWAGFFLRSHQYGGFWAFETVADWMVWARSVRPVIKNAR